MATTAQNVIDSFESTMREKVALSASLEQQWVLDAVAEYNTEIGELIYSSTSQEFDGTLSQSIVTALGYLVKLRYLEREMSRVNKINNIITKDLSLNGNGEAKRMTMEELKFEYGRITDLLNKMKTSSFVN